jgi:DNA-binding MarR family transcriptional regulator
MNGMKYVNDAVVNDAFEAQPAPAAEYDPEAVRLIELLFFAYRDFVAAPDETLARQGMGRAHHRVLHFVNRNPGLPVAELLKILKITKQSLARVLKQLLAEGFIEQRTGARDRRQRLLHTTPKGRDLALTLCAMQAERIRAAVAAAPGDTRLAAERFLYAMIDAGDRLAVRKLVGPGL